MGIFVKKYIWGTLNFFLLFEKQVVVALVRSLDDLRNLAADLF